MNDALLDALQGDKVVHSNALAAITRNCVVVREGAGGARVVIGIETLTGLRKLTTTKPGLLVIAGGLFTIAAAAYASHQGLEFTAPIALIALLFVFGYAGTRRAAVLFLMENDSIESLKGSFREATATIRAVERVRNGDVRPRTSSGAIA